MGEARDENVASTFQISYEKYIRRIAAGADGSLNQTSNL